MSSKVGKGKMPLSPDGIPMKEHDVQALIVELRKQVENEFEELKLTPKEIEEIQELVAKERIQRLKNNRKKGGPYWYQDYGFGWNSAKKLVKKRSGGVCEECKKRVAKSVHHKLPVRFFELREHAHFLENLIHLCKRCHIKAHRDLAKNLPLLDMMLHFSKPERKER